MKTPKTIRSLLLTLIVVSLILGLAWWDARTIKASYGYNVEAAFSQMPPDDAALDSWLRQQPGVAEGTVHVTRDGNHLNIIFIMTRDLLGNPPFPHLDQQSVTLGYIAKEKWHDAPHH